MTGPAPPSLLSDLTMAAPAQAPCGLLLLSLVTAGTLGLLPEVHGAEEAGAPTVSAAAGDARRPLGDVLARADASADAGWESEAFSEAASAQLKKVIEFLADGEAAHVREVSLPKIRSSDLRPPLPVRIPSAGFEILRAADSPPRQRSSSLEEALTPLREALSAEGGSLQGKCKIIGVTAGRSATDTTVLVEAHRGRLQINAQWQVSWQAEKEPLITAIALQQHEEVRAARESPFIDRTAALFGRNESWHRQLVHGAPHWHAQLDVAFGIHQGNQGIAITDVNGDGLDDIHLCQPDGLPNLLFIQQPDGTLLDQSARSGLDFLDVSRSALFVDLDNDGDADFLLAHRFSVSLLENDGSGKFTLRHTFDTDARVSGLSAADYDNDGLLDFHVCGYSPMSQTSPEDVFANPVPYHDARNGAFNYLFRNEGGLRFRDVTAETGMNENNTRFSFAAAWEDFDNDGDQDLYVANDFGRNNLYRNELVPSGQARFRDVAAELGVEDIGAGMSADWGDVDNDGFADLYVGNMWSSAGHRITSQGRFKPEADAGTREQLQRHARGNSLFLNRSPSFRDVSLPAGVNMGRWAWGSLIGDLNNDGWQDIYVANGFMTAPDPDDL